MDQAGKYDNLSLVTTPTRGLQFSHRYCNLYKMIGVCLFDTMFAHSPYIEIVTVDCKILTNDLLISKSTMKNFKNKHY